MLLPMEIRGEKGISLNDHVRKPIHVLWKQLNYPKSFPVRNTVTGHLSVIYTVECQINFTLQLIASILRILPSYHSRSVLPSLAFLSPSPSFIEVKPEAACADSAWIQCEAKNLVWSSSCINWAIDPKIGMNNMMYPDWQFLSGGAESSFGSRISFIRTLRVERRSTCVVPPQGA